MTRAVVFQTQGKLDLRAITIFGLNAKPNTRNPIGYFGTGLKYATAVLAREQIPVTIWVGKQKWTIKTQNTEFRTKKFWSIYLQRHRKILPPDTRTLPFTTEYGKNWELKDAFRELYSNTLDELGETYVIDEGDVPAVGSNKTLIIVRSEKFVETYLNRSDIFLPEGENQQNSDLPVQVIKRPSNCIYYRGIRVMDLPKPSMYTYNILQTIDLTEDRTAKYEFEVKSRIANYLIKTTDKEVIRNVLVASDAYWEYKMEFDWGVSAPSEAFLDVFDTIRRRRGPEGILPAATAFVRKYAPEPSVPRELQWYDHMIEALDVEDWAVASMHMKDHPDEVAAALRHYYNV